MQALASELDSSNPLARQVDQFRDMIDEFYNTYD
jgi:hypothetical protein